MATSLIPAIMDFYASLNFATADQKRIFLDEKPQKTTVEVNFPYAILIDDGMVPVPMFEYKPQEVTTVRIEVFATTLEEVDAMIDTIRFNGSPPENKAGIDNCLSYSLPASLGTEYTHLLKIVKGTDKERGKNASLVYKATISYEIATYYV